MGALCGKSNQNEESSGVVTITSIRPHGENPQGRRSRAPEAPQPQTPPQTRGTINYSALEREMQMENYAILREDFYKNPDKFILNQLMLLVQFFPNFDRSREIQRSMKHDTEEQMRGSLSETKQKPLVSDAMFFKILDHVGFRASPHDSHNVLEQLMPTVYHIMHDVVETHRPEDFHSMTNGSNAYTHVDPPHYRTCVEPSSKQGYVFLRCVDDIDDLQENSPRELQDEPSTSSFYSQKLLLPNQEEKAFSQRGQSSTRDENSQPGAKSETAATSNRLLDRIPTPIEETKLKGKFHQSESDILEDEEDGFESGSALLRSIEKRVVRKDLIASVNRMSPRQRGPEQEPRGVPLEASQSPRMAQLERPDTANSANRTDVEDAYRVLKQWNLQNAAMIGQNFKGKGNNLLPPNVFKRVEMPVDDGHFVDDDPVAASLLKTAGAEPKEDRVYLSPRRFMLHFAAEFYELARRVGKGGLTSGARILDPRIMCTEERVSDSFMAKETSLDFIPTVEVAFWPNEGIEWCLRKRKKIRDKRTGMIYQWPSTEIVSQAQQIGCNVVPVGFISPKKIKLLTAEELLESGLQWRLQFARIEGMIQRELNHPKIRCLLFALLIHKTFLTDMNSITPEHIKHLFYSKVEREPTCFVEETLGRNLLQLFVEMKGHLKRQRLPNYYLWNENLLASVPRHKLAQAQERFHRIQEHLVPLLMVAIKRLHFDHDFYPAPDMDELYHILSRPDRDTILMANPALLQATGGVQGSNVFKRNRKVQELNKDPYIQRAQELRAQHAENRRMEKQHRQLVRSNNSLKDTLLEQNEIIDPNMEVKAPLGQTRGRLVLEFFIRGFLDMSRRSHDFSALGQSRLYIHQAENLLRLLADLGFSETMTFIDLKAEAAKLKQVSKGTAKDYWHVNWGQEEVAVGGGFPSRLGSVADPLPSVPQDASPILGTTVQPSPKQRHDRKSQDQTNKAQNEHDHIFVSTVEVHQSDPLQYAWDY